MTAIDVCICFYYSSFLTPQFASVIGRVVKISSEEYKTVLSASGLKRVEKGGLCQAMDMLWRVLASESQVNASFCFFTVKESRFQICS